VALSVKKKYKDRPFVMAPYKIDAEGHWKPDRPTRCPEWTSNPEVACNNHVDGYRTRVFSPGYPFVLYYCLTHNTGFAVYPPAWCPHGRKSLAPLNSDGESYEVEQDESAWKDTEFGASVDAAMGDEWPEEVTLGPGDPPPDKLCRETQKRHIQGALRLFGLFKDAPFRQLELISLSLSIDISDFFDGAIRVRDGPSLRNKGVVIGKVLQKITCRTRRLSALILIGTSCGFWGPLVT
jgi:hypothetical protein